MPFGVAALETALAPLGAATLPFGVAELETALAPLGTATMLPAAAYTCDAVLAWELLHLFAGTWSCIGREAELRADDAPVGAVRAATQRALRVGEIGVLLTWADDGAVRAFANTCRHRGHELLPDGEKASKRSIICPYHAWSYGLDGAVRATPGLSRDTSPHGLGLVELPVQRWGGWLFVHALHPLGDAAVPPFATHLGAFADIAAPYATSSLVRRARHTYEVAANWKVLVENYHECGHCPLIHPELCRVSPPDSGDNYDRPGAWVGGSMDLRDGVETMSLTGRSQASNLPGVDPRKVEYLGLFPNLLLSLHPDYVMAHRLVPLASGRTWVECGWYFADSEVDASHAVEFWDVTNRQDWAACESVQRGLSSPHFRPGPFATNEDAVHRFVTMVARAYLGQPLSAS